MKSVTKICSPNPLPACKKFNIEGLTFHSLRHTFATYTHNAGIDIKYVQDLSGHSDIKTTMVYINPALQMILNGYLEHAPEL
ncbi:tyrosine-type recombinase/integrase [candidate division KSB1 bacterium]|nr:tyrosine-type recombinase/integrase [candidate division KSB1 bacterium]